MSQENVDALQRASEAFNEGDLDRALELWDSARAQWEWMTDAPPSGHPCR
jgi:hypothetical protein